MDTVAGAQDKGRQRSDAVDRSPEAIEIGDETKITSHVVLARFDKQHRGLEALHRDLFDPSAPVVLSALQALGELEDARSLPFVARLLNRQEEALRCAAAKSLGTIGGASTIKLLSDLFMLTKNDRLRCAALEGLAEAAPAAAEVVSLIKEQATSRFVAPLIRSTAALLLAKIKGSEAMTLLLSLAHEDELEGLYVIGREHPEVLPAIIGHGIQSYDRLPPAARAVLAGVTVSDPMGVPIFLKALEDDDASVRGAVYAALGTGSRQSLILPNLVPRLIDHREPNPTLEEELLAAISRIELAAGSGSIASVSVRKKVLDQIQRLFAEFVEQDRSTVSDSHELGWLMNRAREYLEFYATADFRAALQRYLKGDSNYSANELMKALKASAVRVEVRHFDGFRALADIIREPRRRGIVLVMREITSARLGKRDPFNRLVRLLRMTRLIDGVGAGAKSLFLDIFRWADEARLFRLAEAALGALARVDAVGATALCRKAIEPPIASKILAIATIRLLRELDWKTMEPALTRLLKSSEDTHVLLNLLDALSIAEMPKSPEHLKAAIALLRSAEEPEIVQQAATYLAAQAVPGLIEPVMEGFEERQPWKQQVILSLAERKIIQEEQSNRDALTDVLYRILRNGTDSTRPLVAVLLLRLGDDYATTVLKDIVREEGVAGPLAVVQHLKGAVTVEVASLLYPLLLRDSSILHEALRGVLLDVTDEPTQERICRLALALRGVAGAKDGAGLPAEGADEELHVDLLKEKTAFRFEREFLQEVAILFTDIQGYSKKAQALSSLQLTALIQDYENILLPTISAHNGELIKRMGDGHLFIFPSPMEATLAGLRLQKALKRFNSYREESLRLTVRVGIHWGKVVRKDGDVLGNHVNIASRLESSAKGGSILISDAVHANLAGHILCNEIGLITVKNISEPIRAYEPYEIAMEFPEELDPLKRRQAVSTPSEGAARRAAAAPEGSGRRSEAAGDGELLAYLSETFAALNRLCLKLEKNELAPTELRKELVRRWQAIKAMADKPAET